MIRSAVVAALAVAACGRTENRTAPASHATPTASTAITGAQDAAITTGEDLASVTPNALIARGTPTIIVGTRGDEASDRAVVAQAEMLRELFPTAAIVPDTSIDVAAGPSTWPPNPVIYGGAHVNTVVAALADTLPVHTDAGRIVVGDETHAGVGVRVIAAIPAAPNHPAFLLYAGTGTPGVVEINGIRHGVDPLLIADVHGHLQRGTWIRGADGNVAAKLGPRARRIAWRFVERAVAGVPLRVAFPEHVPAAPDEAAVVDAIVRGTSRAATSLQAPAPPPITIYVYPDRKSKESLTGDSGDGHAVAAGAVVHVIRFDPAPGGPLENLVTHEAAHAITGQLWGPAGSPLLNEGIAVWASGQYGGVPLAQWQKKLASLPPVASLLPARVFRGAPEQEAYPFGGLLVTVAIERVGFAALRDHLFLASARTWADACTAAGTTPDALDAAIAARR